MAAPAIIPTLRPRGPASIEAERYVSVHRAASIAGLHPLTIYKWIAAEKIPAWGKRGSYRVRLCDIMPPVGKRERRDRGSVKGSDNLLPGGKSPRAASSRDGQATGSTSPAAQDGTAPA